MQLVLKREDIEKIISTISIDRIKKKLDADYSYWEISYDDNGDLILFPTDKK